MRFAAPGASPGPATVIAVAPPVVQPIPPYAMPDVLDLTTYGNAPITANKVGTLGGAFVVYNIPSINQTLLSQEISQGNLSLFPSAVSACSVQESGQTYIRVSGFSDVWWGGSQTNSTEFVFGGWESFLTSAQGWPAEPACAA